MELVLPNIVIPNNIKRIKIDIGLSYNAPQSAKWLETETNRSVCFRI